MKILIAADHAGYNLKESLKVFLSTLGHEVQDFGAHEPDQSDDYPDYIHPLAQAISADPGNLKGIIIGGSGQGEAIVANRYPHVRAIVYYDPNIDIATLSREHNDANIISFGARFISPESAQEALLHFLDVPFSHDERHVRRIKKIERS